MKSIMSDGWRTIELTDETCGEFQVNEMEDGAELRIVQRRGTETIGTPDPVSVNADQLAYLARELAGWFGFIVLDPDQQHAKQVALRDNITAVLEKNEARCLDDDIDRGVVIRELMKALG